MNCKLFKSVLFNRKARNSQKNSKHETSAKNSEYVNFYIGFKSISEVIRTAPAEHLESIVCKNFPIIFKNSYAYEFHHFAMFSSWKNLLLENIDLAILKLEYPEELSSLISIFPEHEAKLYNELLKAIVEKELNDFSRSNFSITEDILIPLAYLEKYCKIPALNVRSYVKKILIATYTFSEFYDTINVLENYFDIPHENLKTYIDEIFDEEIEMWIKKERSVQDIELLEEFFASSEAYDLFMKNITKLLHIQGIELYACLLKILGPTKELLENEYACHEYYQ